MSWSTRPYAASHHLALFTAFCQALVDDPEVFERLGFTGGSGSSLIDPCLSLDFFVDDTAEIMGTQVCVIVS